MRTPDFLIIGAAKSGTTSLSYYLSQHPKVEIVSNRLEHFGEYSNVMMPDLSQREYLELFNDIPKEKLAGEKSASYLYSKQAPLQIKRLNPDIKILAILRNPIDRAYSDYWHKRRNGMESLSFEDALHAEAERIENGAPFEQHYATYGLYANHLRNYFSSFGKDQCLTLLFDELRNNPGVICKKCFNFLELDEPALSLTFDAKNKGSIPKENFLAKLLFKLSRNRIFVKLTRTFVPLDLKETITRWMNSNSEDGYPEMPLHLRKTLSQFYEEDIRKLENILERDLSHWLSFKKT